MTPLINGWHPSADLFPLLEGEELSELVADVAANGLREPIWLYEDPELGSVILDGRNRAKACELAGVAPRYRTYTGHDPTEFSVSMNLKRRHLSEGQRAALAVKLLPLLEEEAARHQVDEGRKAKRTDLAETLGADRPQGSREKRNPRARDRAGKAAGTSGRSVARMKRITEQAADLVPKIESGDLSLDRADRIIRDRQSEATKRAEAAAEAEKHQTTVDIRHGDFRQVLADLDQVDAIITDPPYPREFLPLLADLAAWADKVLTDDGILAVLMGQTHLPEVYRLLDGHRPYRWTGCLLTPGQGYVSHPRQVQSNWKPLLVYGGGRRFADTIRSEGSDAAAKDRHKWGQDYAAFHTIVERLTRPGQLVVDPFMGSGTTLLAAKALGRHTIGADVDLEHVESARRWLA